MLAYSTADTKGQEPWILAMKSSDNHEEIFNLIGEPIVLVDNSNGRILEVNSAAVEMYGYSYDELLQMHNTDVSAEPEKTAQATHIHQSMIPVRYHKKKDGTVFPVEISARHYNWHGADVHLCVIREISQKLAIETDLLASEQRFRSFIENANDLIYTLSAAGIITYVAPNVEFMLGYLPDELIGTLFEPLIHPEELPTCRDERSPQQTDQSGGVRRGAAAMAAP